MKNESLHPVFDAFPPRRQFELRAPGRHGVGVCVTVASQKGGVGKTTTAVNLAAGFGLSGAKTLLFDFDPQANATSGVGREKWRTVPGIKGGAKTRRGARAGFLDALEGPDYLLSAVKETDFQNLWVLPSFEIFSDTELIDVIKSTKLELWKRRVAELCRRFDAVFIDCPPSLGGIPTLAFETSDQVLIPVQCEYYAMEGLSQILPVIDDAQNRTGAGPTVAGLLMTMYSDELELSREVLEEVQAYFPDLVYRAVIPRDVALAEAASHGLPVVFYNPYSRGAWSYLELTREVLRHEQSEVGEGTRQPAPEEPAELE